MRVQSSTRAIRLNRFLEFGYRGFGLLYGSMEHYCYDCSFYSYFIYDIPPMTIMIASNAEGIEASGVVHRGLKNWARASPGYAKAIMMVLNAVASISLSP